MLKMMAAARRRPGMTHAEYTDYIVRVHGALARKNPVGLARYVQNHVFDGAYGSQSLNNHIGVFHRDSITELYFSSAQDLERTFAHEYTRTVIAPDGVNFAELSTNLAFTALETILVQPTKLEDAKIMHFLFAADGNVEAAQQSWGAAHEAGLAAAPEFRDGLSGLVRSDVLPTANSKDEHFGGGDEAGKVAVVASLRVADDLLPAFRRYEAALMAGGAFEPHLSFFVFAREVPII